MKHLNKLATYTAIALILCTTNAFATKNGIKLIDIEHHYYTPEFLEGISNRIEVPAFDRKTKMFKNREGIYSPFGASIMENSVYDDITDFAEGRIAQMDKAGVDVAVLSCSAGIEELPKEDAVKYAKQANDAVYATMQKYPNRFMGTAMLPTPYVDEAIKELRRCHDMGFKYWHTHSNFGESHLYEEKYDPLFTEAEKLGMAVYVHPQYPTDKSIVDMGQSYAGPGLGFGQDVMQTVLRLILNGTFDRHPNLKVIIGHLGEYYPFFLDRMDNRLASVPNQPIKKKHPLSYYFKNKNIFVTTSGNMSKEAFKCTKDVIGIDNILFGSDYPYEVFTDMTNFVESLDLTPEEREKVYHKNGEEYILK